MTKDEIIAAVSHVSLTRYSLTRAISFREDCESLCARLRHSPEAVVFDALFDKACAAYLAKDVSCNLAGHCLFYVKPRCPISCRDAIWKVSVSEWNLSLEEVPYYLADQFGIEAMYRTLEEINAEDFFQDLRAKREDWKKEHERKIAELSGLAAFRAIMEMPPFDETVSLNTMGYWLDIFASKHEEILADWKPMWQWGSD